MSIHTAHFRRYIKHTFRKDELALIEALERQRHRTGRVRAVIDDPHGKYPTVLRAYILYIQHLDKKDALIVEQAISLRPNPRQNFRKSPELQRSRVHKITPRSYLKILGAPKCIGQILLLNSHAYCPSLPLCRSRLDQILQLALPYVNGPNTVVIIHGSTHTPKNTRFRHWLNQAVEQAIYLPYGADASSLRCAERKPRKSPRRPLIVEWRPSHGRIPRLLTPRAPIIPNSPFLIPNSKAFAA